MLKSFLNVWKVADLRRKVLFTLFILVVYRLGSFIPVPGVDLRVLDAIAANRTNDNSLFGLYDLFVGGNFSRASIFALGIMPYITSSIVLQLLGSILPYFEKLKKEGPEGQRKMQMWTRLGTLVLAAFNAIWIANMLQSPGNEAVVDGMSRLAVPSGGFMFMLTTVVTMVTGTMTIMWLGDQITEHGIGNGISLIIFAGIVARYPSGIMEMVEQVINGGMSIFMAVAVLAVMVFVTAAVIVVTEATRKIPVQYAQRIIGNRVYGGRSHHIPLKVNSAGVIPIIFAQSVIMFPLTILRYFQESETASMFADWLSPGAFLYTILYVGMIIFFAYFYTAIVLNPREMADNMKKHGGSIPGIKPGRNTANYINRILARITLPGAVFFAFVAVLPQLLQRFTSLPFYFGGTGLIIIVGVALDTLTQIDTQLQMRHYDSVIRRGKLRGRR